MIVVIALLAGLAAWLVAIVFGSWKIEIKLKIERSE